LAAITVWVAIWHTAAVVVASLPFAYTLARLFGKKGVVIGFGLAAALYVFFTLPGIVGYFASMTTHTRVITLFDAVKLVGILPLLVWMFRQLPSNNRIERRVNDKVLSSSVGASGAHAER
jgi:hypothetical protein